MKTEAEKLLEALEPLFYKADRERKWFYSHHQGVLFSPRELRDLLRRGFFLFGVDNWKLVDPPSFANLELEREKLLKYNEDLKKKIDEGWES